MRNSSLPYITMWPWEHPGVTYVILFFLSTTFTGCGLLQQFSNINFDWQYHRCSYCLHLPRSSDTSYTISLLILLSTKPLTFIPFALFTLHNTKVLQRLFRQNIKCPKALCFQGFPGTLFAYWYFIYRQIVRPRLRCPVCALPTKRLRCTPTAAQ